MNALASSREGMLFDKQQNNLTPMHSKGEIIQIFAESLNVSGSHCVDV